MGVEFKDLMGLFNEHVKKIMDESLTNERIEVIVLDVLMKHQSLFGGTGYLSEADLIKKYRITRTFLSKLRKEHYIEKFKSGKYTLYSEKDYLEACKKHVPKKPLFIRKVA
ncbi:MAG TPA: hypothetical protein PK323_00955 [Bacteroidia bacterium]|nr:hypothetical protein [Bacteroidia bacterium]